ncbi:MAG: helix-turn-helix transcriptional regulator [Clostridia bacterium]|nr:helix-turn-helix transcriptional regulator [Clostridia bacterium]
MNNIEKKYRKSIGKKIKLARSKTDYTQEMLAEKLSLSARYISQLERGIAFGSATTIVNLCKALNINSNFLFEDIIASDSPTVSEIINPNFLEDYLQLDNYNKEIIHSLAKQLIKMQNNEEERTTI